ncbi:MAG TPA: flagellar hook-length control protein FliK [Polyangiaceae bacterium]|nr:flagellar hook-length control protein FliK [Polyangiaceae bacterium]
MSETSQGIGAARDPLLDRARELEERDREELAKRFAIALAPQIISQLPPPPPKGAAEPPGGWRGSDGVLTPTGASEAAFQATAGAEGDAEPEANQRIVLRVQTRDLGEVSLVLDRSEGAVRVVVGVQDASTVERMLPERDALARQLQGSGLTIQSIQFVRQSEVGTVLAQSTSVGRARTFATQRQPATEDEKVRRRGSRKLNLIG